MSLRRQGGEGMGGYSTPGELGQEGSRAPSPLSVILLPWDLVLIPDPGMGW